MTAEISANPRKVYTKKITHIVGEASKHGKTEAVSSFNDSEL